MRRGDVVIAAAAGDYGKPRPAAVIQSNVFPDSHASVIDCQMNTERLHAPDFRIAAEPGEVNGLRERSQVMADKPVTVRRERVGSTIGRPGVGDVERLDVALAFVSGLADRRRIVAARSHQQSGDTV